MSNNTMSKIRLILEDAQDNVPVDLAVIAEGVYGDIENLDNFIKKRIVAIENDGDLNPKAKSHARRIVFEQAGRKLEELKDKRNNSSMLNELETESPVEAVKDDPVLKFLREKEIRDRLAGMTERQILSLFGESLFDGSYPLLADAILNAPAGFELLPEDDLEKLRSGRTLKKSPQHKAKIEFFRKLHASTSQMFSLFKKEIDTCRKNELPKDLITKKTSNSDRVFRL